MAEGTVDTAADMAGTEGMLVTPAGMAERTSEALMREARGTVAATLAEARISAGGMLGSFMGRSVTER